MALAWNGYGDYTCTHEGLGAPCPAGGADSACANELYCAHGGGGPAASPAIGGDATDDAAYPYVCCAHAFGGAFGSLLSDEWCAGFVAAGERAEYGEQCASQLPC